METTSLDSNIGNTLAPCGPGCRFAEAMRGEYSEWIWCSRPGASTRVRHASWECRFFTDEKSLAHTEDLDRLKER